MPSIDKVHGDEHLLPELTPEELVTVERRARELVAERLADPAKFSELMQYIEPSEIDSHVHRCMQNIDRAAGGERIGMDAILNALCHVQRRVQQEAESVWMDECMDIAEKGIAVTEHVHAELICAWAKGAAVQWRGDDGEWRDWDVAHIPPFGPDQKWRLKPEHADFVRYFKLSQEDVAGNTFFISACFPRDANIEIHFDAKTSKPTFAKVIE